MVKEHNEATNWKRSSDLFGGGTGNLSRFQLPSRFAIYFHKEYLAAEVMELGGNATLDFKRIVMTPRHIMLASNKSPDPSTQR